MKDAQLVLFSAKAVGKHFDPTIKPTKKGLLVVRDGAKHQNDMVLWQPLTNYHDVFQLILALRIWLVPELTGGWSAGFGSRTYVDSDPCRAVTRCAADIGLNTL